MHSLGKRSWLVAALLLATTGISAQQALTAEQLIAKMREAAGIVPGPNTVDTIKAGDPQTVVTGIATTISPTMDVLRKAVAAGDNLIVTHEPSFYNHLDKTDLYPNDPVLAEKLKYIADHKLVVFRWHDGAHAHQPDFIMEGWKAKAGWAEAHREPGAPMLYTAKPVTVAALAEQLRKATGAKIVRVIGDPKLVVTKIAYAPGAPGAERQIKVLERDDVEVLVGGEIPEWETISYAWDAQQQGRHKALILMGHYTSEEPGMDNFANWLRKTMPGLRVDFIPAGEPYWLAH
ncbi:Nif3-like dinuclear metal center hexameric protein [Terriglobus sp. TAA 43]|uniref:Nif3-like dinuclear metal center hexameric protein n=1 Tax=Terriglobus sp. TAA 43 TaxID=278961 RepID=UPI0009FBB275|nr:Nif3-like dinuclear metal center hexameric protein [Terriglobus sp. TAA 43]